jgi:UDP-glucose 4-epimerase
MKVVVTGGAGFIGGNLVRRLVDAPEPTEIVIVDDLSTGSRDNIAGFDVDFREGSILDTGLLDAAFAGAAAVVHLAALPSVPRSIANPLASHEVNATGTLHVLEAARRTGSPHVIVASSSSVYGSNPQLPKTESMRTAPMSPYAVSKLAAEAYTFAHAACYGMDVLALRFFNVFGPLQPAGHAYAAVIPAFVDAALGGRPLSVYGDGSSTRDFTFVDSVTAVITDAIRRGVTSIEPVNLAFGTRTSLNELIELLSTTIGSPLEIEYGEPRKGDVPHSQADSSRLHGLFPDLTPVPLEEGLRVTVEWVRAWRSANTS